jgi:hypothetical protein
VRDRDRDIDSDDREAALLRMRCAAVLARLLVRTQCARMIPTFRHAAESRVLSLTTVCPLHCVCLSAGHRRNTAIFQHSSSSCGLPSRDASGTPGSVDEWVSVTCV